MPVVEKYFYCSVYYRGDRGGDGVGGTTGSNTLLQLYIINGIIHLHIICRIIIIIGYHLAIFTLPLTLSQSFHYILYHYNLGILTFSLLLTFNLFPMRFYFKVLKRYFFLIQD